MKKTAHLVLRSATLVFAFVVLLPSFAALAEPIEVRVRSVRQEPIQAVAIYAGRYYDEDGRPLARTNKDGIATLDAQTGDEFVVKARWSAPLQLKLQPRDFDRGYVVSVLYNAARLRGSFNRGLMHDQTKVLLEFADPWLIGRTLESQPQASGRFEFEDLPAGLAFLSVTIEGESLTRRYERAIRVSPGSARNYPAVFLDGTSTLVGRVVGPDGTSTAMRVYAGIESTDIGEEFIFDTAADGTFEVSSLPNGRATFRAVHESGISKRVDGRLIEDQESSIEIRFDRGAPIICEIENAPIALPMDIVVLDDHHPNLNHPTPGHARIYLEAARLSASDVSTGEVTLYGAPRGRYTIFAQTRVADSSSDRFSPPTSAPVLLSIQDDAPVKATLRFESYE